MKTNPDYAKHVQSIEWSFVNVRIEHPPSYASYGTSATIELLSRFTNFTRVSIRERHLKDHLRDHLRINDPLPSTLFPCGLVTLMLAKPTSTR